MALNTTQWTQQIAQLVDRLLEQAVLTALIDTGNHVELMVAVTSDDVLASNGSLCRLSTRININTDSFVLTDP